MGRPACVARVLELEAERRPRFLPADGVGSRVRAVGNATGLRRMGVWLRAIEPGLAGTHRHFHSVEEEWAYVLSGTGVVRIGPHRVAVRPGTFVGFPPGPRPHHFLAGEGGLVVLEGGERRPEADACHYVDLGRVARGGQLEPFRWDPAVEQGERAQCVQLEELPLRGFQHEVDPASRRTYRSLGRATGLARQAVKWTQVEPGARSTAYHTHTQTDEWIYVLGGSGAARVGDVRFQIEPGDFIAHPAGSPPHAMEPATRLTYLMGGEIDPNDVVVYPEAEVQKRAGRLEPLDAEDGSEPGQR